MDKKLIDTTQSTVYPDKSIKHRAAARQKRMLSLGLDDISAISFNMMERRLKPPRRDSVYVSMDRITEDENGTISRETVVSSNIDGETKEEYPIYWDPAMNPDKDRGAFAQWPIDSRFTQTPCDLEVTWHWTQNRDAYVDRHWTMYYSVREYMPTYASFNEDEKQLCMAILNRFWGLFDNHYGNGMPNLAEEVQTHFSYENVANDMEIAVSRINSKAIQPTSYGLGESGLQHFPKMWYNLLMTETMIDVIREFVYGYIEQPNIVGQVGVAYADRRDYVNRWNDAKRDLESDAAAMMSSYSRAHINFGASSVLVGGGLFGGGSSGNAFIKNSTITAIQKGWYNNIYQPVNVATPLDPNARG